MCVSFDDRQFVTQTSRQNPYPARVAANVFWINVFVKIFLKEYRRVRLALEKLARTYPESDNETYGLLGQSWAALFVLIGRTFVTGTCVRVRDFMNGFCKRTVPVVLVVCSYLSMPVVAGARRPVGDARARGCGERMRIRRAWRVTKSTRRPLVEMEFYSDRGFPALNAAVLLLVGEQYFHGGGYGDYEGHVLVFKLTPEEFAKLRSGDEVIVTYQGVDLRRESDCGCAETCRVWRFGRLNKRKITAVSARPARKPRRR